MKPMFKRFTLCALLAIGVAAHAADGFSLKPPPGARVAIVMFEDLECPDCARAYPVVWETANAHKVPVVLHDFPLSQHPWSFEAAVYARYFDTKSEKLGNDFRGFIFSNQPQITQANLRQYVQKFADQNKTPLPFNPDPQDMLKEKVRADRNLGTQIGLEHTPTIFVVSSSNVPAVEVTDRSKLSQIVEDMLQKSQPKAPAKPVTSRARKKVY